MADKDLEVGKTFLEAKGKQYSPIPDGYEGNNSSGENFPRMVWNSETGACGHVVSEGESSFVYEGP